MELIPRWAKQVAVANIEQARLPRPHLARRQEAEKRIFEAALAIVAERGLDGLTLQEAGEAAGYSRALPAHYYGAREAMLAALVQHVVSDYHDRLRATTGELSGLEALFAELAFLVGEAQRAPQGLKAFYEVINGAAHRPALAPTVDCLNRTTMDRTTANLRAACASEEVDASLDVELQAMIFLSSIRGLLTCWLAEPASFNLQAGKDALAANFRAAWSAG